MTRHDETLKGTGDKAAGRFTRAAAEVIGSPRLDAEGKNQERKGEVRKDKGQGDDAIQNASLSGREIADNEDV
jgi:uncharacterized protein YjbJ (UPF0337 family)